MKYKGQLRGKFFKAIGCKGLLLIVFLLIVGIFVAIQYTHEDTVVATVQSITTQQNVSGGGKDGEDHQNHNKRHFLSLFHFIFLSVPRKDVYNSGTFFYPRNC